MKYAAFFTDGSYVVFPAKGDLAAQVRAQHIAHEKVLCLEAVVPVVEVVYESAA